MSKHSFNIQNSKDKLTLLITEYEEFIKDDTSSIKATNLSTNAWHMVDWVFEEFPTIHGLADNGAFRNTLYPRCSSLKIIHDIANGTKHKELNRPKASIKTTKERKGTFDETFDRTFDISALLIELADGSILFFLDEIKNVMDFWKDYFKNDLGINIV